jgi:hypothetical protein
MGWIDIECPKCAGIGRLPDEDIKEAVREGTSESLDKLDTFSGTAPIQIPPKEINKRRGKHDKA